MPHRQLAPGALLAATVIAVSACGSGSSPTPPPPGPVAVGLQALPGTFDFPVLLTAPAGDPRLFVVEKGGTVRIVKNGAVVARPFLDISALVSNGGEQGLLGLAFAPDYATSGRVFVSYTDLAGNSVIASYRVSADPDSVDAGSAAIRLTVTQPYDNHNGGNIVFGPDGYLYFGLGDGGSGGDPQGRGQDRSDLLGSLLRLDVAGATGYAVPNDNPFRNVAGARPELWDWGLRNPWRFSFDRTTGDLYVADVGQSNREEVNVSPATAGRNAGRGLNYGWNTMEGSICYNPSTGCDQAGLTLPTLDYTHADGCSVTGGFVYRGSAIPDLRGTYLYADFCAGWVRSFRFAGGAATDRRDWPDLAPGGNVTSFGEDGAGELYVLTTSGAVYKIVPK